MKKYFCLLLTCSIGCFGTECVDTEPTFDDVLEWIEEAERCPFEACENGIILLGDTGSGKSTLANLLAGNDLKVHAPRSFRKRIALQDPDCATTKIEHSSTKSGTDTIIPLKMEDGTVLWDCPGFFDTGGVRKQFINAFAIHKLIKSSKHTKIAIVISETMLAGRGADTVVKLFTKLRNLFSNNLENCTTVVVTKSPPGVALEILEELRETISDVYNQLVEEKEQTKEVIEDKKSCELILSLLENEHFAFFPSPIEQNGEAISKDLSYPIIDVIKRSEHVVLGNEPAFVVSDSVASCLKSVKNDCKEKARKIIRDITETIKAVLLKGGTRVHVEEVLGEVEKRGTLASLGLFIDDYYELKKFKNECDTFNRIVSFLEFVGTIRGISADAEKFGEKKCVDNLCSLIGKILEDRDLKAKNQTLEQTINEQISEKSLFSSFKGFFYDVIIAPIISLFKETFELITGIEADEAIDYIRGKIKDITTPSVSFGNSKSISLPQSRIIIDAIKQEVFEQVINNDEGKINVDEATEHILETLRNDDRVSDINDDTLEYIVIYLIHRLKFYIIN